MDVIPTCIICPEGTVELTLVEDLPRRRNRTGQLYRRRRFRCHVCDYEMVFCADGYRDEYEAGDAAKMDLEKQFKQEENNEDKLRS
jgi:hypothetical protein